MSAAKHRQETDDIVVGYMALIFAVRDEATQLTELIRRSGRDAVRQGVWLATSAIVREAASRSTIVDRKPDEVTAEELSRHLAAIAVEGGKVPAPLDNIFDAGVRLIVHGDRDLDDTKAAWLMFVATTLARWLSREDGLKTPALIHRVIISSPEWEDSDMPALRYPATAGR